MEITLIEAAPIAIPDAALADLQARLALTRWPEKEPVVDWSQGAPLAHVRSLCEYWQNRYDWRRCEAMLNGWNPQRTTIDGIGIHFFHVRSAESNALPVRPGDPETARLRSGRLGGALTRRPAP